MAERSPRERMEAAGWVFDESASFRFSDLPPQHPRDGLDDGWVIACVRKAPDGSMQGRVLIGDDVWLDIGEWASA